MGSQRVRHDLAAKQQQQHMNHMFTFYCLDLTLEFLICARYLNSSGIYSSTFHCFVKTHG